MLSATREASRTADSSIDDRPEHRCHSQTVTCLAMSVTDEIKDRLDIVDVISAYVPLKCAGRTFKGLCPFHCRKTPSFVVYPDEGRWHCFGACGTGGDAFTFVMKKENLDFGEALRLLAAKAGVVLEEAPARIGRRAVTSRPPA